MSLWNFKRKPTVLTPLDGYNRWASTYGVESNPIKNLSDEFIERSLPDLKGKALLDAGCGTGKFCAVAEKKNAAFVTGLDLSQEMINEAKKVCPQTQFICADISNAAIDPNYYDVVICALVMGHLNSLAPSLTILLTALKKDGIILLTDFHPFLTMLHSKRTFNDRHSGKVFEIEHHLHLFSEYFKIFHDHGICVETLEEPSYQGNPVVFGIRARKL